MITNRFHRMRAMPGSSATRVRIKRALFTTDEEAAKILSGLKRSSAPWMRPESPLDELLPHKKSRVDSEVGANECDPSDSASEVNPDVGVIAESPTKSPFSGGADVE